MKGREIMNSLLIFFALPIAVIIISIALQKILKCPPLVAAIIFSIFLIVTFIINNLNFLIATIVYTIISFITATIICLLNRFLRKMEERHSNCCNNNNDNFITLSNSENDTFNCNCKQRENSCNYQITNADGLSARINIIPNNNQTGNGNTNSCGCCRRR